MTRPSASYEAIKREAEDA